MVKFEQLNGENSHLPYFKTIKINGREDSILLISQNNI
jgi:hypothetical protein